MSARYPTNTPLAIKYILPEEIRKNLVDSGITTMTVAEMTKDKDDTSKGLAKYFAIKMALGVAIENGITGSVVLYDAEKQCTTNLARYAEAGMEFLSAKQTTMEKNETSDSTVYSVTMVEVRETNLKIVVNYASGKKQEFSSDVDALLGRYYTAVEKKDFEEAREVIGYLEDLIEKSHGGIIMDKVVLANMKGETTSRQGTQRVYAQPALECKASDFNQAPVINQAEVLAEAKAQAEAIYEQARLATDASPQTQYSKKLEDSDYSNLLAEEINLLAEEIKVLQAQLDKINQGTQTTRTARVLEMHMDTMKTVKPMIAEVQEEATQARDAQMWAKYWAAYTYGGNVLARLAPLIGLENLTPENKAVDRLLTDDVLNHLRSMSGLSQEYLLGLQYDSKKGLPTVYGAHGCGPTAVLEGSLIYEGPYETIIASEGQIIQRINKKTGESESVNNACFDMAVWNYWEAQRSQNGFKGPYARPLMGVKNLWEFSQTLRGSIGSFIEHRLEEKEFSHMNQEMKAPGPNEMLNQDHIKVVAEILQLMVVVHSQKASGDASGAQLWQCLPTGSHPVEEVHIYHLQEKTHFANGTDLCVNPDRNCGRYGCGGILCQNTEQHQWLARHA